MTHRAAAVGFTVAALDLAVITAPSLILAASAEKGGLPGSHGLDLVVASAVVGSAHAALVWRRVRRALRHGSRVIDAMIASFDALVVLALAGTILVIVVLGGFAQQHTVLVNRGWPVVGLWVGIQALAVTLSELTRRGLLRWLEPDAAARRRTLHRRSAGTDAAH